LNKAFNHQDTKNTKKNMITITFSGINSDAPSDLVPLCLGGESGLDMDTPFMDEVRRQEAARARELMGNFIRGWTLGVATMAAVWLIFTLMRA
jgi:hypothetical protein